MIAAGHECINHSHNHRCGGPPQDCGTTPTYSVADFPTELDLSTQLIQTNTGIRPIFFIHPYDAYTTAILDHLKNSLGYIGTRAGTGSLNTTRVGNIISFNVYPHQGNVILKTNTLNYSSTNRVVEFGGSLENNQIVLKWTVTGNGLKDYYVVEKLENNQNIKQLSTINGKNNDVLSFFSYNDVNPEEGANWYRLTSVGTDGVSQISDWLKINYEHQEPYPISPNPVSDEIDIDISSENGKWVELMLITPVGQIIRQEKIESVGASHQVWDLDNIPTGQYYIKIKPQGKREVVKKVIVIK